MKKLTDGKDCNRKVDCIRPNLQPATIPPPAVGPQPVIQMTILGFDNGQMAIKGLPLNLSDAQTMLMGAGQLIAGEFVKLAKEGKLDGNNTIIQSQIIQPKSNIQVVK